MKKIAAAAVVALLLSAGAASAQRIDSPYRFLEPTQYVGVFAGTVWLPDSELQLGPTGSAPVFGARWALRVSGPFSVAAEVDYIPSTRTVRDTVLMADSTTYRAIGEADVGLLTIMGTARLSLMGARTWNGLHPFLEVGGGAALDIAGTSELEEDMSATSRWDFGTSFAGHAGAGIEWFPSQRVSLRADARNVLWKLKVPDAFLLSESIRGRRIAGSEWENNLMLAVGFSVHF